MAHVRCPCWTRDPLPAATTNVRDLGELVTREPSLIWPLFLSTREAPAVPTSADLGASLGPFQLKAAAVDKPPPPHTSTTFSSTPGGVEGRGLLSSYLFIYKTP